MRNPGFGDERVKNVVGARMRQARLAFNPPLTQDQLAGRLAARGVALDRVAITKIECGQRCVFDFELPLLSEVLNVDIRWLLGMQMQGAPSTKAGRSK